MRKLFTSLAICLAINAVCVEVIAQPQPLSGGLIRTNLSQVRFMVNTPSNLAGLKKATLATWGDNLVTPLLNQPVVRGFDSLAALPLTNPSTINGKICLLFRGGGITFAQKAQYAVNAGAIGVIIVNNVIGDPIAMGNTGSTVHTVPIVMINNADGVALNNALINGTSVTVSLGSWNLAVTHDLAILPGYQSGPHAMHIPLSQLSAGASRLPYKNFVGGAVINYGTTSETGIMVTDTVTWNPTAGASTNVHTGSYTVPDIAPTDSVKFGFGSSTSAWNLNSPTTTGSYAYKYWLSYANTDQVPQDNYYTFNEYVTDSMFCKGGYDYNRNQPRISLGIQPGNAPLRYSFGPMYYMAKGKHAARKMQYYVSKNAVETLDGEEAYALLFKWVDGSNSQPKDTVVQGDELKLVGFNPKNFTTADSNGFVFTVNITDPTVQGL